MPQWANFQNQRPDRPAANGHGWANKRPPGNITRGRSQSPWQAEHFGAVLQGAIDSSARRPPVLKQKAARLLRERRAASRQVPGVRSPAAASISDRKDDRQLKKARQPVVKQKGVSGGLVRRLAHHLRPQDAHQPFEG
jgi:hypothetical protein